MKHISTFKALLALFAICCLNAATAQVYCPSNINFELGSLNNWSFYIATNKGASGLTTLTSTTPLTNRHVLTSGTGTDYYGGFPIVDPIGGNYSLRLGNDNVNAQVDQAQYIINVPASVNNYSLIYRYAVVLEDPGHSAADQPFFWVRVYDSATNAVVNCASFMYVSQSSLPGFSTSSHSGNHTSGATVYYKPWATASLNLSGQAGRTLIVEFTAADCSLSGHMGYGYVDMSCGLFAITSSTCNAMSPLSAPPGFQTYTWYNANYTAVIDTGRAISVTTPTSLTQYHVVLTPYPGYGCPDTLTARLIGTALAVNAGPDTMLCNNQSIVLSPTVSGNAPPYSYSWAPAAGLSCTTCLSPAASPLAHTNYILAVTDSFGCVRRDTVNVKAAVVLTASGLNAACFGSATGGATAIASLGTGPYAYSWNTTPARTTATAASLAAGTYTVIATDTKGCTAGKNVIIAQPPRLVAAITGSDSVSCNGGSNGRATATAGGGVSPYAYRWNTTPVQTTATATGLPAGIRIVTVTDSNACTDTESVLIVQPLPLEISINQTAVLCHGGGTGIATATGSGGTAPYTYAADAGIFGANNTLAGLNAGPHTIHLRDVKGCTKDTIILMTEPAALAIGHTRVQPLCNGAANGSVTISASGGTSAYLYALGAGSFSGTIIYSGLTAGVYVLHVKDANNCTLDSTITIAQPAPLVIAPTTTPVSCYSGTSGAVSVAASGGTPAYTYAVDAGSSGSSASFNGLSAGMHIVHVTDANGCTKDSSISITQPPVLDLGYTPVQPLCNGVANGTVTIFGTGGTAPYQYSLNTGSFGTSGAFGSLAAGTYTLHVKDANNCTKDSIIILTQPVSLGLTTSSTGVSCNGGSNGTAQVAATGGTSPYTYSWTGTTQVTAAVTGLSAGSYTVTVTDTRGCALPATVSVTQPTALAAAFTTIAPVCNNTATGSATVAASGGTAPYTYSWNTTPARTTAAIGLLASGTYSVTITDSAGCTLTASVSVAQTPAVTVSVTPASVSCFGGNDGTATATPSGSSSPYTYSWSTTPVQTGATATSLKAGTYTVTATSAAGCMGIGTVSVPQPAKLVTIASARGTCPSFNQGSISAIVNGGTSPYSYQWNTTPAQTAATASGLAVGTYSVAITDSKGCRDSAIATIMLLTNPEVDAGPAREICRGSEAFLSASGARNYLWSPAATLSCSDCPAPVATPPVNTLYTVVGTDSNGCTGTDTISIFVMQHVPVSVKEKLIICEGDSARLGASGGIAWQWLPADSANNHDSTSPWVRPRVSTIYKVIITENRCFKDTIEQEVEVLPTPTVRLGPDIEALIGATVQLNAEVTGASFITWSPVDGLSCSNCFTPQFILRKKVTYVAEVKNSLGCLATDTINIRDICDERYFYFANTFTPNGDGQNDRFYPQSVGTSQVAHFMIYDRWGEIVFSAAGIFANDPNAGWDGTFRNQALKPDVYVYVMDALCENGTKVVVRGDVTLIR